MLKRLPLWSGLVGAGWMIAAIRLVFLPAVSVTNYIGPDTGKCSLMLEERSQFGML
jgi:hypothetical protein